MQTHGEDYFICSGDDSKSTSILKQDEVLQRIQNSTKAIKPLPRLSPT